MGTFVDDVLGIESGKTVEKRQNEAYQRKLNRQRDADVYAHNLDIHAKTGTKTSDLGTTGASARYITLPDGRRLAVLDETQKLSDDNRELYDMQGGIAKKAGQSLSEYLYGGSKANVDNTVANELINMWKNTHLPELDRRRGQLQNQNLQMGFSPDSEFASDALSNFNRSADKAFYDMYSNEYQKAYNRYNTDRAFAGTAMNNALTGRLNMTGQLMGQQTHSPLAMPRYDTEAIHKIARDENPGSPGLQIAKSAWDWNQEATNKILNALTGGNSGTGGTPASGTEVTSLINSLPIA